MVNVHLDLSPALVQGKLSEEGVTLLREQVYAVYTQYYRDMPWRHAENPYHVLLSEIMLQQTQVSRVREKYLLFTEKFPEINMLAEASRHDLLVAWSGLGYNRRALFLQRAAQKIIAEHGGRVPQEPALLEQLPGIGPNTAGSIAAFAYGVPTIFIETNIRAVFLHLLFPGVDKVPDSILLPLVAQTVDQNDPRSWYYALMDYGAVLKQSIKNPARRSKHHVVQSKFVGSDRQVRGAIIRALTKTVKLSHDDLLGYLMEVEKLEQKKLEEKLSVIVRDLVSEGFLAEENGLISLA